MWLCKMIGNRTRTWHSSTRSKTGRPIHRLDSRRLHHEPLEERALLSLWTPQDAEPMATPLMSEETELVSNGISDRFVAKIDAPDPFESNDSIADATVLGSLPKITLRDLTLHMENPGVINEDYFQITASDTGMMLINCFFAHADSDVNIELLDVDGNQVLGAESVSIDDNEQIAVPVVSQEQYFLHVISADEQEVLYELEIETFMAPTPTDVFLYSGDDTGRNNLDNVTNEAYPQLLIQAWLDNFDNEGIPILSAADVANGDSGAAIEIFVNGVSAGYADQHQASNLFTFDIQDSILSNGVEVGFSGDTDAFGFMNLVSASVHVFDGQTTPADAHADLSGGTMVTFDPNTPALPSAARLLESSDSGVLGDGGTNLAQPAFVGEAEVNALVRIYAGDQLVGEGVVGSDVTNGVLDDGLGTWEIAVEPLADGAYTISLEVEDLAGNITNKAASPTTNVLVDTLVPQRPTLDLVDTDDSGSSDQDNYTLGVADFRLSAEIGSWIQIKDGETVIDSFVFSQALDDADGESDGFAIIQIDFYGNFPNFGIPTEGPHPLSAEAFDETGNRSAQSEELLVTVDVTAPLAPTTPNLIVDSDSGLYDDDDVTNIDTPTFMGYGEANSLVRLYARNWDTMLWQLVGEGQVGSDESDGDPSDGLGVWEITIAPLDDGVYDIAGQLEDLSGNHSNPSDILIVEIDTLSPNTPFLDLLESDDTGRHNDDNVTMVRRPLFSATSEDPNDDLHWNEENLIFRIFDRPEEWPEVLRYDSLTVTPYTLLMEHQVIMTLELMTDGIHNLKLEVEDRAGNISEDFLLDVLVDTSPYLGDGDLHPESDSGVSGFTATMSDLITSDKSPDFFGTAEANNLVMLEIDGLPAGSAVAIPLDGDDATQPPLDPNAILEGNWQIESNLLLADGEHEAIFTFEDPAGNQISSTPILFFIDTQGPRITNVTQGVVSLDGTFQDDGMTSLFEPKPSGGPDEMISTIVVHFQDTPDRTIDFIYDGLFESLALEEGNYQVVGDANGNIPILDVVPYSSVPGPGAATAEYELVFHRPGADGVWGTNDDEGSPLPDDRFTLTISDALADPAGNALDGESGANAPFEGQDPPANTLPIFPTGDGVAGGPFISRFTVDSRPELGTWGAGSVWVDTNGNFYLDPNNPDSSNRDITYTYGFTSDDIFAGNFAATALSVADGFDKLAAYGRINGSFRWSIDVDNDGAPDLTVDEPANISGLPVSGRFDGSNFNGDEVAVVEASLNPLQTIWHFDTDHDFQVDYSLTSQLEGHVAAGDIDGDGFDDLVAWTDDTFQIDLANGTLRGWDGVADHTFQFGFIGIREQPVVHDMDGDGFDDLGLWVPDRSGYTPEEQSEWYFLVSGGTSVLDRIEINADTGKPTIEFLPTPFGDDFTAQLGDEYAIPIVGNFDPPLDDTVKTPVKQTVQIAGTDGDDILLIEAGSTPDAWNVVLNGVVQEIATATAVDFLGGEGQDSVTLVGTNGVDNAEIWSDRVLLIGENYEVSASQVETISVDALGGVNSLVIHDSPADDTVMIGPAKTTITAENVSVLAERFELVNALADQGGNDVVRMIDSVGDDHLSIAPGFGLMTGEGFSHRVQFFERVLGYAREGGTDSVEMHDSVENDRVVTLPIASRIDSPSGLMSRAKFFETVSIVANVGGRDSIRMKDSPGDDTFVGRPKEADMYGDGYSIHSELFEQMFGYSIRGGHDIAKLYDSPGDDTFVGRDWYSKLAGEGFQIRVKYFDSVYAYANSGGFDTAHLIGSMGNDLLVARDNALVLSGHKFLNRAKYFDIVEVTGRAGIDEAIIRDAVIEEKSVATPMPPDAAWQTAWIEQFEHIQQKNIEAEGGIKNIDAVDLVFRAFWN